MADRRGVQPKLRRNAVDDVPEDAAATAADNAAAINALLAELRAAGVIG